MTRDKKASLDADVGSRLAEDVDLGGLHHVDDLRHAIDRAALVRSDPDSAESWKRLQLKKLRKVFVDHSFFV